MYICQISNYYVVYPKPKLYVPYISIKKARVYHSSPLIPGVFLSFSHLEHTLPPLL